MQGLLERLAAALEDRYAVESEIGRGGMATVFLAEDLKHHRRVAIKVLHPELAIAVGSDRFLREIEAVAGLTHPHVLPLHDSGEADGLLFYVMPYVEGESLGQRLDRERQLSVKEAVRIALDVAEALGHAHRRGLVHRDVKPGNILLEEGHAVVTDFGIARALSEAETEKATATGMSIGTPAYMSPEQAGGEEVDERSDIYSLGCVLYEMLAGEPPLIGSTPQATAAKRLTGRATPLPVLRSTVSLELDRAVQKSLERSPADRFATTSEFATALESGASERVGVYPARRRLRPRLTAAIAISAVALAGWLALRAPDSTHVVGQNSIAVLPFVNMSADLEQEYFSDGISEELLNLLAKTPQLRVVSRTSAFYYRGKEVRLEDVARQLGVAHVLEGSVRKSGDRVRIAAQLIDARTDTQLWSRTWDRTLDDVFAVQDEIAADVAAELKVTLLGKAPRADSTDAEAYVLYLRARQLGRLGSAEGWNRSNELIEQALRIDSAYVPAWAQLARNYFDLASMGKMPFEEGFERAREAANRARGLDPDYAPAYALLGSIARFKDGDPAAAARNYERALQLAPGDVDIVSSDAAVFSQELGRVDEAIALQEYAVARDPVNSASHLWLGYAYCLAGRWDEAIARFRSALELSPDMIGPHFFIAWALLGRGEPDAALQSAEREPDEGWRLLGRVMAYHTLGRGEESDAALAEMMAKYEREMAYQVAIGLAYRDEPDRAFAWLEKAVEYGDPGLAEIAAQPLFVSVRDDPRWLPFLARIGKSPTQLAAVRFEVRLPE